MRTPTIQEEVVGAAREVVEADRAVGDALRHGSLADVSRCRLRFSAAMNDLSKLFDDEVSGDHGRPEAVVEAGPGPVSPQTGKDVRPHILRRGR